MSRHQSLPVPPWLRQIATRLPSWPPSLVAAQALNRLWWPMVDGETQKALSGRVVELCVDDLGVVFRLMAGPQGLVPAASGQTVALRLKACAPIYWRLLQGRDDPDTLFFDRLMVMEGDTEFGLLLKNTLDAVGPPRWPSSGASSRSTGAHHAG
ncbi:MAG: SCP2 sterol-binding domain-containing protein [Aquabacterium sp.]|uniref:ubiquinone anaerobic biosynthesis accessory factor UbiT n=1 Tax=Aquabacterium sp. TaxID=1872578 RepID=UPI0025C6FBA9|nr:SCP2 sterol-binding domain-containing protein [Aquabacterium sp.]MBI5927129.1 SCP2 sterol-binding domain-containing protein [Aquabacterium sp.]